jgi:hypothetical protein
MFMQNSLFVFVKDFLQKDKTFRKVFAKTEFLILKKLKEKITANFVYLYYKIFWEGSGAA